MTRIRIAPDGTVRGLWSEDVDWQTLGHLTVERASHVEFCERRQLWHVRAGRARNALRAILQMVLRRPIGEILHWAASRENALAWEREHFGPGGDCWPGARRVMAGSAGGSGDAGDGGDGEFPH